MATDIILDDGGDNITIQAFRVKAAAPDLLVDSPDRRRPPNPAEPPQSTIRRALVHDFNDGLTLNWAGDYPGGITLNNVSLITPNDTSQIPPVLVIKGGIRFDIQTLHQGPHGVVVPTVESVDLQEFISSSRIEMENMISSLRTEVDDLKARVSALETSDLI